MRQFLDLLKLHPVIAQWVELLLMAVATVIVLRLVLRLERKVTHRLLTHEHNINQRFVESAIRFGLILIAVIWVVMSSPITRPFGSVVFQGTAIIGGIVGLAAQPVIADMICGLMISTTQPFNIGDRVELEDGTSGVVRDITLRHVLLETIDTLCVVIPNSKLNGMRLTNMSFHSKVQSIHFRFNVSYTADVEQAKALILQGVKESPFTIEGREGRDYGPVYFVQCAESSLVMAVTVYFNPTSRPEVVMDDINTRVKRLLDEGGVEIPYNYVNVVMKNESA